MPKVAVIILNWNQPQLTKDTINSFLSVSHANYSYDLIIVDNGSTDNSYKIFQDEFKDRITLLQTGSNLGYVGGNNYGLDYAFQKKYDYYLVSNNDVIFKPDFLEILVDYAQKYPEAGVIGPKIYFAPGHEFHHDRYSAKDRGKVIWSAGGAMDWDNIMGSNIGVDDIDCGQFNQIFEPDFISGCCMLITHSLLAKIGYFDEKFYLYLEDTDFCQRAKKAGFHLLFVPESIIWHINSGSTSPGSQIHNYFLTRNRLVFASRYARLRTKLAVIRESLRILLFDPAKWRKTAVIDFYLNRLGRGSWQ